MSPSDATSPASGPTGSSTAELVDLLDLETLEVNLFRGSNPPESWPFRTRVFGGQVLAQALVAAQRTVDLAAHSLHAYFLLAGDPAAPILYEVERVRDGRSFATRRTVAIQHGRPIFIMSVSFHREEPGLDHQLDLEGEVPGPEGVPGIHDLPESVLAGLPEPVRAYWLRPRPIELKPIGLGERRSVPRRMVWFRAAQALPDDPALHRAVLAYATDMTLLEATTVVHGTSVLGAGIQAASLDHALWLHRPFRADGWLLYVQDSPSASGARGLARGLIYDRAGRLIASVAQEGLIRPVGQAG
ncbi:acyl-CoA thioesterase II [Ancylobacter sp. WKF20]|uniref:acyl-CoA thioesterase n=1 Tax=Ancylobacter sp. WKF20 TaxID=3039801 RepID=UPI0024341A7F|nr:acyl-CoA thioesterase II [Ancylobacter sp. WKF20]WGD29025.1 acyl-CoA thioesterase II [Ancylobacter sp. WKF20]